jgi:intracellular multiplication protein IcmE
MSEDTDVTEPETGEAASGARKITREKKKGFLSFRNIAVLSVLVVGGAVAFELWNDPDRGSPSKLTRTPNLDDTPAGDQLRTSERYQENLRQQNQEGARLAEETDTSFIATPDEPLRQIDEQPPETPRNANRPLPPANAPQSPAPPKTVVIDRQQPIRQRPQQQQAPNHQRINQLAQIMATQQQGLLNAWQVHPSGVTVVVEQDLLPNNDPAVQGAAGASNLGSGSRLSATPAVRAGDVVLASTIITNDSDTPGPVVVEIRRGDLRGTRLVGGFQPNQANTHMIVQFDSAILPDGEQLPVSAYAVDARQKSLAVRSDYDRRIFERYAPRVAATFVAGLGSALSDPGSTVVDLGNGVGIARPEASFEQGIYRGLAEVGNDLADEFVRNAPKGALVSLRSRQIIGVLFTSNVVIPGQ